MRKLYGLLCFASFIGALGCVGGIEREILTPRVGMLRVLVCLLLFAIFGLLAGAFKESRHE